MIIDWIIWPINTLVAIIGIALAAIDMQHRVFPSSKVFQKNDWSDEKLPDLDSSRIKIIEEFPLRFVKSENLHSLVSEKVKERAENDQIFTSFASSYRDSYFFPIESVSAFWLKTEKNQLGNMWHNARILPLYFALFAALILSLVHLFLEINSYLHLGVIISLGLIAIFYMIVASRGIYMRDRNSTPILLCGFIGFGQVRDVVFIIQEIYQNKYRVLLLFTASSRKDARVMQVRGPMGLEAAIGEIASAISLLTRDQKTVKIISRAPDLGEAYQTTILTKIKWGSLALFFIVASWWSGKSQNSE